MIDPKEKMRRVELVPHDPTWPQLYATAAAEIKTILQANCLAIHHIGSTSIPKIFAKPLIDILPVVQDLYLVDALNPAFEKLGYVCMGEYGIPGRRFFWRSQTQRTHNVHLFAAGSPEINRHLAFRDFMNTHDDYAQAYSLIKRNLAAVFPTNIQNYVEGKSSFIQMIDYKTGNARAEQLQAQDNIVIEAYNPAWPQRATAEIETIKAVTKHLHHVTIEHIGSTAVPEIAEADVWINPLATLGYVYWDKNPDPSHRRFFKGMPPFGMQRTHHIHIVDAASKVLPPRILFRDILRSDPNIRSNYAVLKNQLAAMYPTDRELYTNKKTAFIEKTLSSGK